MATFRFRQFLFDTRSGRLIKGGGNVRLQRKPQQLLTVLLENSQKTVTREQLHSCLWPGEAYRDFETGLNVAVKKLRDALCDSADQPTYVATEVGLGYRFIARVEVIPESATFERGRRDSVMTEQEHGSDESAAPASDLAVSGVALSPIGVPRPIVLPITALLGAAGGMLVLIALGMVSWNHASAARPLRAVIALPREVRLMTVADELGLALSPDGTEVVFSAAGSDNRPALWLRRMDSLAPQVIPGTEGGAFPFWSPDSKSIGFFVGLAMKRVDLADYAIKTLCPVESGRGGTWSKEGVILFSPKTRGPIYRISADGGEAVPLTVLDETRYTTHRWPAFLSDGKHFVYLAGNHEKNWAPGEIFLASLDGRPAQWLGESDSNVIPVGGSLTFLSHGKLMSQALNLEKGTLESHADILADAVESESGLWYGEFSATATEFVYRPRHTTENNTIAWFDRKGNKLRDAGPPGVYWGLRLGPDDKTIVTSCGDPEANVCLIHADDSITQITQGGINGEPAWASDSSFISYYTHQGQANYGIAVKPLDPGSSARVVVSSSVSVALSSWHPDKIHALVSRDMGEGKLQYFIFDLATRAITPFLPADAGLNEFARFSPDGNWIAYTKKFVGRDQICIASYPAPIMQVKVHEGRGPKWRGDGRELFYLGTDGNLYAVPVTPTGAGLSIGEPQLLFHPPIAPSSWDLGSFDVNHDGTRFVVDTSTSTAPSELVLTTNWQASRAK